MSSSEFFGMTVSCPIVPQSILEIEFRNETTNYQLFSQPEHSILNPGLCSGTEPHN